MSTLGQGPSPRKNPSSVMGRKSPSSAMGRILLGMDIAEDERGNLPLVVTLHIVPQNRKSTKAEKDNKENDVSKGKAIIIAFSALCLTLSYFSVLTTTPNNWKEGLMGQAPTPGTLFRSKETTIKRE